MGQADSSGVAEDCRHTGNEGRLASYPSKRTKAAQILGSRQFELGWERK